MLNIYGLKFWSSRVSPKQTKEVYSVMSSSIRVRSFIPYTSDLQRTPKH